MFICVFYRFIRISDAFIYFWCVGMPGKHWLQEAAPAIPCAAPQAAAGSAGVSADQANSSASALGRTAPVEQLPHSQSLRRPLTAAARQVAERRTRSALRRPGPGAYHTEWYPGGPSGRGTRGKPASGIFPNAFKTSRILP